MAFNSFNAQGGLLAERKSGRFLRPAHRWISIVFTSTVGVNFLVRLWQVPPDWITYAPLPPLFFLMATGLCMFMRPYFRA